METKYLGNTQIKLPEIGFGTWNYTGGIEPLQTAIDHGACLIDTAENYGTEGVVGEAIRGRRDQVFLATKAAPRNFRRGDLIAAAERSLRRLATDHIDLYQLHWPNYAVPIAETMSAMEELVDMGKIRFIGVSNFSIRDLRSAQAALKKNRIVANQVRYSLIERTIEGGLLKYCQENAISIIAFSPLGTNFSQFKAADPQGELARVAALAGKAEAQAALNWLIAKDGVVTIPKASTAAHVSEDCGASGWRLSDRDYASLASAIRYRRRGLLEIVARRLARNVLQHLGKGV
jgi:diketogulonate reductase-like aldo/keto reductase